jgi:hypothetical protein
MVGIDLITPVQKGGGNHENGHPSLLEGRAHLHQHVLTEIMQLVQKKDPTPVSLLGCVLGNDIEPVWDFYRV